MSDGKHGVLTAANCWIAVSFGLGVLNLFLVVMLWNISGSDAKPDSLAISLTVLEIFLAVVAVGGFFLIRGAAMSQAAEEAAKVAEKAAKERMSQISPAIVRREVEDYMSLKGQKYATISTEGSSVSLRLALDDGGEDD